MREKKQAHKVMLEAVAEARDEALVELGREAEARQVARAAEARKAKVTKMALAAAAAGAAVTAGAVMVNRRRARKRAEEAVPLSG
ncbi:MAG TPA: hypothetical protein VFI13_10125, partial [Gemmatimonadales bacterium]|nr:hypothetical protein [Gemmatimonadales bacterium]